MLHAKYDGAFLWVCINGHIEIAKWLWNECKTSDEQSAMLHELDDLVFRWACQNGHIETAKWLWSLCQTLEEKKQCCMQKVMMLFMRLVSVVI